MTTAPTPPTEDPKKTAAYVFLGQLLTEQARLLRALSAVEAAIVVYETLALGTPAPPPSPTPERAAIPPKPTERSDAIKSDPGPGIEAEFEQVRRWAVERGIRFTSWEDLPAVNDRRFALNQARFKRLFVQKGRLPG